MANGEWAGQTRVLQRRARAGASLAEGRRGGGSNNLVHPKAFPVYKNADLGGQNGNCSNRFRLG